MGFFIGFQASSPSGIVFTDFDSRHTRTVFRLLLKPLQDELACALGAHRRHSGYVPIAKEETSMFKVVLAWVLGASLACTVHAQEGVTPTTILLGQSAGLTGPQQGAITELVAGANAYWNMLNAKGGVHGRTVQLKTLDDGFDPKRAGENAAKLVKEDKIFAYFLGRGTPHSEAAYKALEPEGVPMIAPSTGAAAFYDPKRPLIFTVRSPYQDEAVKIVEHFALTGVKDISIVHVNDAFGRDGLAGASKAMDKAGLKFKSVGTWETTNPNIDTAYQAPIKANPVAVILVGALKPTTEFVKRARAAGVSTQFATLSNNSSSQLLKELGAAGRGLIVGQVQPSPYSTTTQIAKEFQAAAKVANAPVSYVALEGFIAAKVFGEALQRAGREPTRAKLIAALETMNAYDVGGLTVSFGPGNRSGSHYVDLSMVSADGRFVR
jgi:branched-chain amino acid transport system substrate-binding protein